MRLLFDQNLSFKLVAMLADAYPGSTQVRLLDMAGADDRVIWDFARVHGFRIVSLDVDFAEMAALHGPPPQVVWLRCGNQPTATVARLLRNASAEISALEQTPDVSCLEIYG